MMNSRGDVWQATRDTEDLLALITAIDDRRKVIRAQAWHEGDWHTVYLEATAMREDLQMLKAEVSERWAELYKITQGEA